MKMKDTRVLFAHTNFGSIFRATRCACAAAANARCDVARRANAPWTSHRACARVDAMPCPKGTRTKGLTRKYHHNARVDYELKRQKTARYIAKQEFIAAKLAEQPLKKLAIETEVPTIHGVLPAPEPKVKPRATLDVVKYRTEAKGQGAAAAGVASTSGGLIGKLAFDGTSDMKTRKRKQNDDGSNGEQPQRIGTAARKKKKKNKKINARKARQC
jgi:hypothetical protein